MTSTSSGKRSLLIAGRILLLLIVALGIWKSSGTPASYFDPYGFLFVLVGGIALMMISFPAAEIGRAFRHAAGGFGSDTEIRNSAYFWEAAGRGFWILGGLRSVLSIMTGFASMSRQEYSGMPALIALLIPSLLSTLYGILLAVICFVPCWKLMEQIRSRLSAPEAAPSAATASIGSSGWNFGTIIGYVIFLATLVSTFHLPYVSLLEVFKVCIPSFLVVLGGTLALILFMGVNNTRLTPSAAFGGMGLIGCLMGFIQMLVGMTDPGPQGIGLVAGALAFILASCFTALLGMALIGSPLEDRAIRMNYVGSSSVFSRVSWYVFPLLSLIFVVLVFNMLIVPLPK